MGLLNTELMGLLVQKMSYLNQRQAVLAENVANANTPGYQGKDLPEFNFESMVKNGSLQLVTTHPNDIVPASMSGVNAKTIRSKSLESLPSGQSVDLEGEMTKVSQTSVDYQAVTSIYHKISNLMKIAIKGSTS